MKHSSASESASITLRVSMFWKSDLKSLDPAHISYANEAIILDNMYGNLVAYDNHGQLVPDLAERFYWDGTSYNFLLNGKKKTSKNRAVTAIDAELSLKRLMLLNKNTHGKLQKYLCGRSDILNLQDYYEGIYSENDILKITPAKDIAHDLVLSLLAGIDFKIIPASVYEDKYPYSIVDYSDTTGPYFIDPASTNQSILFQNNPYSYLYSVDAPTSWQIVSRDIVEDIAAVGKDVDLVTTGSYIKWSGDSTNDHGKINIFSTLPIANELLVFSESAINELSIKERAFIVEVIRNFLIGKLEKHKTVTYQFFPKGSVGYLLEHQEEQVRQILADAECLNKIVKIGFPKSLLRDLGSIEILRQQKIEIVPLELHEFSKADAEAIFISTDTAFHEDISLLEYNFSFGIFKTENSSGIEWLRKYITTKNTASRIQMLGDLHFHLLRRIIVAPLFSMPYFVVSNAHWKLNMSKFSASTQIWKMRYCCP